MRSAAASARSLSSFISSPADMGLRDRLEKSSSCEGILPSRERNHKRSTELSADAVNLFLRLRSAFFVSRKERGQPSDR